jgi:hypothetical protein
MQNSASQKTNARLAFENYTIFLGFVFLMGGLSWLNGDLHNLIALKVIFAPFFLLANRAIPTFFKEPIIEPKFTARAIEFHLLMAAVFSGFMAVISWQPDKPVSKIVVTLLIGFVIMSITQMIILWTRIRALHKQTGTL